MIHRLLGIVAMIEVAKGYGHQISTAWGSVDRSPPVRIFSRDRTLKIELRKLETLIPYPNNPRVNDGAVKAVAASIGEFGFQQPVVVDGDGVIVAGHTRWKAAQKLGLDKVPVVVASDLTPDQVQAYRIADNQTATLADWDNDLLPIEIKDLQTADYDLSLLGFDESKLTELLGGVG